MASDSAGRDSHRRRGHCGRSHRAVALTTLTDRRDDPIVGGLSRRKYLLGAGDLAASHQGRIRAVVGVDAMRFAGVACFGPAADAAALWREQPGEVATYCVATVQR
ncbi:hypothetical protein ACKVMT_06605 [Halobacteriales archaeon Cl-PHB]